METAQRLAQTAADLASSGQAEAVAPAVERALANLQKAEQLAATAEIKASARMLAGFLCERFLGDAEAAKANYRAAAEHAPNGKRAKQRLERLERADENVRRKESKG